MLRRCLLGSLDLAIHHTTKFCTIVLSCELYWWINKRQRQVMIVEYLYQFAVDC